MDYEIWITAQCALSAARALPATSPGAAKLCEWASHYGCDAGIPEPQEEEQDGKKRPTTKKAARLKAERWRDWRDQLEEIVRNERPREPSQLEQNLSAVGRELGLDELEEQILGAFVRYRQVSLFENLCDALSDAGSLSADEVLACVLGAPREAVLERLRPSGRLFRLGLLKPESRGSSCRLSVHAEVPDPVRKALSPPNSSVEEFRQSLLGEPKHTDLLWEDFGHIAAGRDFLLALLRGALERRERGVNVLLYGPPGTGKTELCKLLAQRAGAPIYSIGEEDEDGAAPSTSERIASLQLAGALLAERSGALLLFDEMEDIGTRRRNFFGLITHDQARDTSKVFLNRLVETNPVPTLWTSNSVECFDPALRRRMSFALELHVPPRKVRERIWRRALEKESLRVPPEEIARLAAEFPESPALVAGAARAARLAGGDESHLRQALRSVSVLLHGRELPPKGKSETPYDPALLNADTDLGILTERVCLPKTSRRVSFCFSGPPGTGKSAYARHLAKQMDLEVLHKRASDLLSKWVGESEQNIARAFQQARDEEAFLVFDEVDSLLQDRSLAFQNWQVTQVNEMLTWMESHEHPFACTTNFTDRLDAASLRRFTFKVTFGFMTPGQCENAFRLYFGSEPPARVRHLRDLTPGDFAVVLRKASVLGLLAEPRELGKMLEEEAAAKRNRRSAGFAA